MQSVVIVDAEADEVDVCGGCGVREEELAALGEAQEHVASFNGRHGNSVLQAKGQPT